VIYVARQLGHDARLTLTRYGHVIDELEDMPRIEAEAAIANARTERRSDAERSAKDFGRSPGTSCATGSDQKFRAALEPAAAPASSGRTPFGRPGAPYSDAMSTHASEDNAQRDLELPVEELLRCARPLPPHDEMVIEDLTEEEGMAFLEAVES
jgi:hypothetical protein